ncbi:MAG TPA: glycosyltransferase family 4 protein [Candidatus Binatia bacterium]|nr:glycosyltransferase family 4 protein [Candidatus Binatia bacterium]
MTRAPKLTVLHLVANRWWTGSADPVIQLLSGLSGRGHRVLLGLIRGDRFEAKARQAGIEPLAGLSLEVRFHPGRVGGDVRRLRALVRTEVVDVVHTHHSHDHWLGAAARGRAVLLRTFHNRRAVRSDWPSAWLYRRTDVLVAVSREIEDRCRALGLRGPVHRTAGVVDVERFAGPVDGVAVRAGLGAGAGPLVGCVARLAAGRGHELLIRGFALLTAEWPSAQLVLVGKGEARAQIAGLVGDLGLGGRVILAGYRDGDLPDVVGALDVFVLLQAGSDESCRAALEAMAAGCPVVAGRVAGLADSVIHGTTGLLLDGGEPGDVAAALRTLLADSPAARAMGAAGRARARERFGPERHAADMEAVYLEAIARRGRTS